MPVQTPEVVGNGAVLSYSTDGTTYTPFGKIVDIATPKITAPEVKVTTLADAAQKSQGGTPDYGEVALTCTYAKALVPTVLGWVSSKTTLYFQVSVAEVTGAASVASFQAWVKEFDPFGDLKEDEKVNSKLTLKVTGAVTFTPGS